MPNKYNINPAIASIFKQYSITKNHNKAQFVESLTVLDTVKNKVINLKYDLESKIKNDYLFKLFSAQYINKKMSGDNVQGIFLTLTLPSKYHNLDNDLSIINEGYQELNSTFRQIYNNFRIDGKKVKIKIVRVVEPHKSMICHLHAIIYIDKQYLTQFKAHLNNVLAPVSLVRKGWTKFKASKSYKSNIGRFEYVLLDDVNKCTAYLLKYVRKTLNFNNNDEDYYHLIHGWATFNKIRMFTYSSGLAIPRYIFDKCMRTLKLKLGEDYARGENILEIIENLIDIHIITFDDENNIKQSNRTGDKPLYKVAIVKEKIVNNVYKMIDGIIKKVEVVYYKLREFQIIRKSDNLVIYDKSRFILMR